MSWDILQSVIGILAGIAVFFCAEQRSSRIYLRFGQTGCCDRYKLAIGFAYIAIGASAIAFVWHLLFNNIHELSHWIVILMYIGVAIMLAVDKRLRARKIMHVDGATDDVSHT